MTTVPRMIEVGGAMRRDVVEIISRATLVEVDRLRPEARPEELGIDSLGLAEAIFALEEAFDIKVPFGAHHQPDAGGAGTGIDESGLDLSSIGSIVAGIEALVERRRAA